MTSLLNVITGDRLCSDWASISPSDTIKPSVLKFNVGNTVVTDVVMQGGKATVRDANTGLAIGVLSLVKIRKGLERMMNTTNGAEAVVRLRDCQYDLSDVEWFLKEVIK